GAITQGRLGMQRPEASTVSARGNVVEIRNRTDAFMVLVLGIVGNFYVGKVVGLKNLFCVII
ncbi:MAG TPA: hypothetical protein VF678_01165, partial [bacterium]